MPIYEFKCPDCGKVIEKLMPIASERPTIFCDNHTDGEEHIAEKIISGSSFHLKGNGWFKTGGY